jgi:hypothetical protein
MPQQVLQHRAR